MFWFLFSLFAQIRISFIDTVLDIQIVNFLKRTLISTFIIDLVWNNWRLWIVIKETLSAPFIFLFIPFSIFVCVFLVFWNTWRAFTFHIRPKFARLWVACSTTCLCESSLVPIHINLMQEIPMKVLSHLFHCLFLNRTYSFTVVSLLWIFLICFLTLFSVTFALFAIEFRFLPCNVLLHIRYFFK